MSETEGTSDPKKNGPRSNKNLKKKNYVPFHQLLNDHSRHFGGDKEVCTNFNITLEPKVSRSLEINFPTTYT